jgi:hypothetical protein
VKFNESELRIDYPNGGQVRVYGGDDPTAGGTAGSRAITATFRDGGNTGGGPLVSNSLTGTLTLTASNDAEALGGAVTSSSWTEGAVPIALFDTPVLTAVDAPHLYDRPGNPYLGPDGKDWPDNAQRFAALGKAAADTAGGINRRYRLVATGFANAISGISIGIFPIGVFNKRGGRSEC